MTITNIDMYDEQPSDQRQFYTWITHFKNRCGYFSLWLIISKWWMSIYLNFFFILGMLLFIFCNFWMIHHTVPLHFLKCFQFEQSSLYKTVISCKKKGFILEIKGSKSYKTPLKFLRKKDFNLHIFFWGGYRL